MIILYTFALLASLASAQDASPTALPTYISLAKNIHDFNRFADGGADANWYIGFNNAWIVKLPPAPAGDFSRAFIGAKIGRAKTTPDPERPWVRELIEGKIYMGISHTPAFSSEQGFFLVETRDISVEPDDQGTVEGAGPAEWFWAEVPTALVSFTQPNYLIIWSPTKYFTSASSAPILAAAAVEEKGDVRAWNNHSISGVPPRTTGGTLETPINSIYPALAIKLVPPNQKDLAIFEYSVQPYGKKMVVRVGAAGSSVSEVWIEMSRDQLDWERITRFMRRPPFIFTISQDSLPAGALLRASVRDEWGNVESGSIYEIPYARR
ncbi:MAG: hypothetical protein HY549_09735 [Elusimicrobia bacterium]|nr:hypothetical protein [Elusimicrobiota bacterium]